MSTTNFYTIESQMIGYKDSSRKDFLTDALGSVTAEIDQTGNTRSFDGRYKPYGESLSSTGARGSFAWIGTWGYKATELNSASQYVRSRHYSSGSGIWNGLDMLWPSEEAYLYVNCRVTSFIDYFGAFPEKSHKPKPGSATCICSNPPKVINVPCPTCTIGPPPKAGTGKGLGLGTRQSCYQEACELSCLTRNTYDKALASCIKDPSVLHLYPICTPSNPLHAACGSSYCTRLPGLSNWGTGCGESDPVHPGHPLFWGLFGLFNCAEECQMRVCCKLGGLEKEARGLWENQIKECNKLYDWKRGK